MDKDRARRGSSLADDSSRFQERFSSEMLELQNAQDSTVEMELRESPANNNNHNNDRDERKNDSQCNISIVVSSRSTLWSQLTEIFEGLAVESEVLQSGQLVAVQMKVLKPRQMTELMRS